MKNKYSRLVRLENLRDFYRNRFYLEIGRCQAYRDLGADDDSSEALKQATIFVDKQHKMANLVFDLENGKLSFDY